MTREEILSKTNLTLLQQLHIDVDSLPDEILYKMITPWESLSAEEQHEILSIIYKNIK